MHSLLAMSVDFKVSGRPSSPHFAGPVNGHLHFTVSPKFPGHFSTDLMPQCGCTLLTVQKQHDEAVKLNTVTEKGRELIHGWFKYLTLLALHLLTREA